MFKKKKYILDLKFKFCQVLLDWFIQDLPLDTLETDFQAFISTVNISMNQVIECMDIKEEARGGFKKRLVLKSISINKNEKELIQKYFLASGNIFQGTHLINNEVFYEFITEKAVRDKVASKDNIYICNTEILDKQIFKRLLRNKLLEECKEILRAKNHIDLLEEIGDLYAVIMELKNYCNDGE